VRYLEPWGPANASAALEDGVADSAREQDAAFGRSAASFRDAAIIFAEVVLEERSGRVCHAQQPSWESMDVFARISV